MAQKIVQKIEPNDQIIGFSYSFTKVLTEYLKKAIVNREVFFDTKAAITNPDWHFEVNYVMMPVINYLADQIKADEKWTLGDGNMATMQDVCNLLATAEKFLDIFAVKK